MLSHAKLSYKITRNSRTQSRRKFSLDENFPKVTRKDWSKAYTVDVLEDFRTVWRRCKDAVKMDSSIIIIIIIII